MMYSRYGATNGDSASGTPDAALSLCLADVAGLPRGGLEAAGSDGVRRAPLPPDVSSGRMCRQTVREIRIASREQADGKAATATRPARESRDSPDTFLSPVDLPILRTRDDSGGPNTPGGDLVRCRLPLWDRAVS